jgi:hypothetical protein
MIERTRLIRRGIVLSALPRSAIGDTMTAVVIMSVLALTNIQAERQERPRVPKDSVELTVVGCLKGRVLSTVVNREADVERGPMVGERVFRLNGKRPAMDEVKRRNRQLVEVVGIVKRSALDDKGIRAGRVSILGGSPVAGSGGIPHGVENTPVMDISAVRLKATSCSAQ